MSINLLLEQMNFSFLIQYDLLPKAQRQNLWGSVLKKKKKWPIFYEILILCNKELILLSKISGNSSFLSFLAMTLIVAILLCDSLLLLT